MMSSLFGFQILEYTGSLIKPEISAMVEEWKIAKPPNYKINKDKLYPYSELPFLSGYQLLKIPFCVKNLIEHVDYFGQGRIETPDGTTGFPDCYNVHYEYALVDESPDAGRKIPNRVPISQELNIEFSTRKYIKDNSVLTVTVNLETEDMTHMIAQDIARIVNSERGKVIVYGRDSSDEWLCDELRKMKHIFYCPIYLLPDKLRLARWGTDYTHTYLGVKELKRELYLNIHKGDFEAALILTGSLTDTHCGGALGDVVNKLLQNKVGNVIAYAYKLWNNNYKEVVCEHFPSVFQHIFDGDCMAIINKNNQALILEPKTTKARGDDNYRSSKKLSWKMTPIWHDNNVFFKLYNIDSVKYLQLSPTAGEDGVREARGKNDSEEQTDESERFSFSPLIMENGEVAFNILNCEDNRQLLELLVDVDSSEVKAVVGEKRRVGSLQDESVKRNKLSDESQDDDDNDFDVDD